VRFFKIIVGFLKFYFTVTAGVEVSGQGHAAVLGHPGQ
jgi:hypothetical protein